MNAPRGSAATGLLVLAAMLTACTASPTQPDQDVPGLAVVAFRHAEQVSFADARGHVWGSVGAAGMAHDAVWSADGKHLAWLDTDSRLHLVEAATGNDHPQPCPCAGLDRLGDEFATISADGTAMLLFHPTNGSRRVPLARTMPNAMVIAGGSDQVAVAEPVPEELADYRGQSTLIAVDRDGKPRNMIEGTSRASIWVGSTSPNGNRIIAVESPSNGACWTLPGLLPLDNKTLNPHSERLVPTDLPFAQAVLGQVRSITGISWAGDTIVVTFGPSAACQTQAPERYVTYALTAGKWEFLRAGALIVGYGADGRSYGIELADFDRTSTETRVSGKLIQTTADGTRAELANRATAFWPTPAEQAAGQPDASAPPDQRITSTDTGVPIAKEFTELADRVARALESNDTNALAELCAHCDAETLALTRTQQGRNELQRALRTHPAGDDHSMTFPGLTVNRCVDGRTEHPECTVEQFRDIGTLGLESSIAADFPGHMYSAPVKGSIRFVRDDAGKASWRGRSISAQDYRQKAAYAGAEEYYFFRSADGNYTCGFDKERAACQGMTTPIPPRPPACGEGPGWGHGMFVGADQKVDFVCAGGVLFWSADDEPNEGRYVLPVGQTIAELGFTCSAEKSGVRCQHDASGRGFRIAPDSNERF